MPKSDTDDIIFWTFVILIIILFWSLIVGKFPPWP